MKPKFLNEMSDQDRQTWKDILDAFGGFALVILMVISLLIVLSLGGVNV